MMRREYLKAAALAAVASTIPLAGCTQEGQAEPVTTPDRPTLDTEPDYQSWFDNVSNYGTKTIDARNKERVTITVGASANGGRYGFSPAAIAVSPGTTVTWKWSGKGGTHNVHAKNGAFDSGYASQGGHEFSFTFEEPRIYKYQCDPHATMGMKGAVLVSLE